MKRPGKKNLPLTEGQKLYDSIKPALPKDMEFSHETINAAIKKSNAEAIQDYLAGCVAGFLTGYEMPIEGFVKSLQKSLADFSGIYPEMKELRDKVIKNSRVKTRKVKLGKETPAKKENLQ